MPVTAIQLKTAEPRKKDFKVYDEKGLYVLVKSNGSKYWRLKYRHGEKSKTMALGFYPEVSLKEARLMINQFLEYLEQALSQKYKAKS